MSKQNRQYIGIAAAVLFYYIVHEGAHLAAALLMGVFKSIHFLGMGIQIDVYNERMTDTQMGVFCLVGALSTWICGWLLIIFCKKICAQKSDVFRAVMWYTTLVMLLLDPLYLSILCGFFGGGDMNGISLLISEAGARTLFAGIGILHVWVVLKYLLPRYRDSFQNADHLSGK